MCLLLILIWLLFFHALFKNGNWPCFRNKIKSALNTCFCVCILECERVNRVTGV